MVLIIALAVLGQQSEVPKWQAPPGEETAQIRTLIDSAAKLLGEGKTVSSILSDIAFDDARPYPRFRATIEKHADDKPVTMVAPTEHGERLDITFRLPKPGMALYAYHTDVRGAYAKNGVHVQANSGDMKFARLFAYVKSDKDGNAKLQTIRPAGYPNGELPQHIHFHVEPAIRSVGEIWFLDDRRLTPTMRARGANEAKIITLQKSQGKWIGVADLRN